jgi:galactokinase
MTGAGFGGCAIALVEKNKFDTFCEALNAAYNEMIGYSATIFSTVADDGVKQI